MILLSFMAASLLASIACAPTKVPKRMETKLNADAESGESHPATLPGSNSGSNGGVSAVSLSGRQVDLYFIRAGNAQIFLPPEFDKLPCAYFKQGPEFDIPPVPGGPPVALRGPVQNFYSGRWTRETEYSFKLSVYKRIYRDPGIPDWLTAPPSTRTTEYVLKLYDVIVASPNSQSCKISAVPVN